MPIKRKPKVVARKPVVRRKPVELVPRETKRVRPSVVTHSRDPYARRLELPKLPGGMKIGSDASMAMDDAGFGGSFPFQGYAGNAFNLYFPGYPYLAMQAQRTEFRQPVETHAKDMTREWIEFKSKSKSDKSSKLKEIEGRFEELRIQELFRKSLIHDGFFGVGHIFIDLKGHEDTELPVLLDPKSIKKGSLRGFKNIEPMWVTPVKWNSTDASAQDFYVPEMYVALSRRMDRTRLIQVISREVPDLIKPAYNFGGISLSQLIEPYVDRWLKTVAGVNRLINNYSLIYLKTDMSAILSGDETDADLTTRLRNARTMGDNTGAFVLDKTSEELGQVAVPLSGLSELQAQSQEHMAAPTHLPLVVLTGITPSGLNASSDDEIEIYHDWNRSEQYAVLRKPLTHVFHVIQLDMYGAIDPDLDFGFKPVKQITGEALARIKKTEAESAQIYVDLGSVDSQEVREKLAGDTDSGFVNLDVNKEITPPEDDSANPDSEPGDDDEDE